MTDEIKFSCVITFSKKDDEPVFEDFCVLSASASLNQLAEDACVIEGMDIVRRHWKTFEESKKSNIFRVFITGTLKLFVLPTRDDAPEYRLDGGNFTMYIPEADE